jgi:hypothetical protein
MDFDMPRRAPAISHEGFPPEGEMLWEIGTLLALLLGLAFALNAIVLAA